MVAALAIAGRLDFPDTLLNDKGEVNSSFGDELPKKGFDVGDNGFQAPAEDGSSVLIAVSESSDRLH
jgi:aconitate hydratase